MSIRRKKNILRPIFYSASQTLLLGPRFLLSSIKMINCLEKVVDRVDLAERVCSAG